MPKKDAQKRLIFFPFLLILLGFGRFVHSITIFALFGIL